jgi:hypothetical protein
MVIGAVLPRPGLPYSVREPTHPRDKIVPQPWDISNPIVPPHEIRFALNRIDDNVHYEFPANFIPKPILLIPAFRRWVSLSPASLCQQITGSSERIPFVGNSVHE